MDKKQLDKRILKIAERLKELRIENGYTSYEQFAFDNDIPRVQYWRLETGTNFTINTLLKVLDAHQISLSDFFKGLQ